MISRNTMLPLCLILVLACNPEKRSEPGPADGNQKAQSKPTELLMDQWSDPDTSNEISWKGKNVSVAEVFNAQKIVFIIPENPKFIEEDATLELSLPLKFYVTAQVPLESLETVGEKRKLTFVLRDEDPVVKYMRKRWQEDFELNGQPQLALTRHNRSAALVDLNWGPPKVDYFNKIQFRKFNDKSFGSLKIEEDGDEESWIEVAMVYYKGNRCLLNYAEAKGVKGRAWEYKFVLRAPTFNARSKIEDMKIIDPKTNRIVVTVKDFKRVRTSCSLSSNELVIDSIGKLKLEESDPINPFRLLLDDGFVSDKLAAKIADGGGISINLDPLVYGPLYFVPNPLVIADADKKASYEMLRSVGYAVAVPLVDENEFIKDSDKTLVLKDFPKADIVSGKSLMEFLNADEVIVKLKQWHPENPDFILTDLHFSEDSRGLSPFMDTIGISEVGRLADGTMLLRFDLRKYKDETDLIRDYIKIHPDRIKGATWYIKFNQFIDPNQEVSIGFTK